MNESKIFTDYYVQKSNDIPLPEHGKLAKLKCIIIDIDGTMTDGGIYYDDKGNEFKKFNTKDAAGFFAAKVCGIDTVIITGRESYATQRRMRELHAGHIAQGIVNKVVYINAYMEQHDLKKEEVAYIGDDLNDYNGMMLVGFVACPLDSAEEIIQIADYVSTKKGGDGVVRDVISYILKQRGQWDNAIKECYRIGI